MTSVCKNVSYLSKWIFVFQLSLVDPPEEIQRNQILQTQSVSSSWLLPSFWMLTMLLKDFYLFVCLCELSKTTQVQLRPPPVLNESPPGFCFSPFNRARVETAAHAQRRGLCSEELMEVETITNPGLQEPLWLLFCSQDQFRPDFFYWEESHRSELCPQTTETNIQAVERILSWKKLLNELTNTDQNR